MAQRKTVAISMLGTSLDNRGRDRRRWGRWRPTVSMCQQDDLIIDRLVVLHQPQFRQLAEQLRDDIALVSPETEVVSQLIDMDDPWDFEDVYSALLDFARSYDFNPDRERYLIHITTGTHVAQICLFLLNETHYLPGSLIQTSPLKSGEQGQGKYQIIDLDLSKYDQIAARFQQERQRGLEKLKGGIATRNQAFNAMISQIEKVSIRSVAPVLLTGPTGAGKTQLAKRIYQLKKEQGQVQGRMVTVNCATLRGDNAMSALFGHTRGSFTGASHPRAGLLKEADQGLLFLDEIAELGADEQAMLLRAIEEKCFLPLGADSETSSDFQLIAGTNQDLYALAAAGTFRRDLIARINLWSYRLPSLAERPEDFEPNLDYELALYSRQASVNLSFNKPARQRYLAFALARDSLWTGNFRDLNASVTRLGVLSENGRITEAMVDEEIQRLQLSWPAKQPASQTSSAAATTVRLLGEEVAAEWDLYDQILIAGIASACQGSRSMAEAGRKLFNRSRLQKKSANDSHRLRQLLEKYGLSFTELSAAAAE